MPDILRFAPSRVSLLVLMATLLLSAGQPGSCETSVAKDKEPLPGWLRGQEDEADQVEKAVPEAGAGKDSGEQEKDKAPSTGNDDGPDARDPRVPGWKRDIQIIQEEKEEKKDKKDKKDEPAPGGERPATTVEAKEEDATAVSSSSDSGTISNWWGKSLGGGKISRDVYKNIARTYSPEFMDWWLGPTADKYMRKGMYRSRTGQNLKSKKDKDPEIWLRPLIGDKGAPYHFLTEPASIITEGQILYAGAPGVDRVRYWQDLNSRHRFGMFNLQRPEPGLQVWGDKAKNPLAATWPRGGNMWYTDNFLLFKSGWVGTAGSVTAEDFYAGFQFPPDKVPVAMDVTLRCEFLLVCVWDTQKCQGKVAVVALTCWHTTGMPSVWSWSNKYPGMFSIGDVRDYKLLGYIDLPGMAMPTDIKVAANNGWAFINKLKKGSSVTDGQIPVHYTPDKYLDLSKQEVRDSFLVNEYYAGNGLNVGQYGFAVVTSRFERNAIFIDLTPLYQYYRTMYYTTQERFDATRNLGAQPYEWPYTFDAKLSQAPANPRARSRRGTKSVPANIPDPKTQMPKVVAIKTFASPPTALTAKVVCQKDSWVAIATLDGVLHIFRVAGLGAGAEVKPEEIREVGTVAVGNNPSSIIGLRRNWHDHPGQTDEVVVVSRGDRELEWVKINDSGGAITKVLRDTRLVDPVHVEQLTTAMISKPFLFINVCDFRGKKVVQYRCDEVASSAPAKEDPPASSKKKGAKPAPPAAGALELGKMGPDGKALFECMDVLELPGPPLQTVNVNAH